MTAIHPRLKLGYLYGGEAVYQPNESLGPRLLTDYELVYIISGSTTYIANDKPFTAPPGSIIIGHAGTEETYRWDADQPSLHAYFHFSILTLPPDWPSPKNWPHILTKPNPVSISLFKHIIQHIYEHTDWPAVAPAERDCLLLETLLDTLFEIHIGEKRFQQSRPEPVQRAIKWVREQIDETPHQKISLDDIAHSAGCTAKHLCRLFKNSIGQSPARTATLMRLQLSLALLTRSNLNISQIAQRCGFENPLYYSRCFKKTFGRSPTQVRKDLIDGIPPPADPLPVDITPRIHW